MELNQQVVKQEVHPSFKGVEEAEVAMEMQVIWQEDSKEDIRAEELKEISSSNREAGQEHTQCGKEKRRVRENL